jgi:hypothetical protein
MTCRRLSKTSAVVLLGVLIYAAFCVMSISIPIGSRMNAGVSGGALVLTWWTAPPGWPAGDPFTMRVSPGCEYVPHFESAWTIPAGRGFTMSPGFVTFPLWLAVILISLPLFFRRRSHRADACCVSCGYNLTGNTSGVCPECGTAVTSPPETPALYHASMHWIWRAMILRGFIEPR